MKLKSYPIRCHQCEKIFARTNSLTFSVEGGICYSCFKQESVWDKLKKGKKKLKL
jgi:hypothetical protein